MLTTTKRYFIDSIIDRITMKPTERHYRRSGSLVNIVWLKNGEPLILRYVNEGSTLSTTSVRKHYVEDGSLVIETKNTVYRLKPEEK